MKLLLAINTTFILSFIILAMASNAEGAQKEIVEETQEDNVIRQDIKSCNVEIKSFAILNQLKLIESISV